MNQIIIDEKEEVDLVKALEDAVKKIEHEDEDNSSFAFIISGDALLHGLKSTVSKKIMSIGSRCDAVLCCRVTPQ